MAHLASVARGNPGRGELLDADAHPGPPWAEPRPLPPPLGGPRPPGSLNERGSLGRESVVVVGGEHAVGGV